MRKRAFTILSVGAGVAAFFIFRSYTDPTEFELVRLLLLAFAGSGLICAVGFSELWQSVRQYWIRWILVLLFPVVFVFCTGFGVFGATRFVWDSHPRSCDGSTDYGAILYSDTSGSQMLSLDHDLWFVVIFADALPLLIFSVFSATAAFMSVRKVRMGTQAV